MSYYDNSSHPYHPALERYHRSQAHHPPPMDVVPGREGTNAEYYYPRRDDYYGGSHSSGYYPRHSRGSTVHEGSSRGPPPSSYYDDYSADRNGYGGHGRPRHRHHRSSRYDDGSDFDDYRGRSRGRPQPRRHHHQRRTRSLGSPSESRSRGGGGGKRHSRRGKSEERMAQAVRAALAACAIEAFSVSKYPGQWTGD